MQNNRMSQSNQQAQAERRRELIAKFREAFPPSVSVFSRVISSVKKISSLLIDNLTKVSQYFKKQQQVAPQGNGTQEGNNHQEIIQSQARGTGRVINFADYKSEAGAREENEVELSYDQIQPIAINIPSMNSQQDFEKKGGASQNKNQINWHQLQMKKINTKRTRPQPQYRNDSRLIENILTQPPSVTRHFQEIYNQAILDCAEIRLAGRKGQEKEKSKKPLKKTLEQERQDYLRSLGINIQKNGKKINSNHQKVVDMWKRKRQIVQSRPARKKRHVEQDVPPMYCVEKVMEVFEKQSQQFFKERRQRQQLEARIKREQEKLQELERLERQRQAEQENRLRLQRQAQQRARKENEQRQRLNNLQVPSFEGQSLDRPQLDVIPQQSQLQNGATERQIPLVQENVQRNQSVVEPNIASFSSQRQSQQPKKKEPFLTPSKNAQEPQNQSKSVQNQNAQNKSNIKQNPFMKQNASPLKFGDVIKLNPTSIFPSVATQEAPTIGQTLFSKNQNQVVPNIFNATQTVNPPQQPQLSFLQSFNASSRFATPTLNQPSSLFSGSPVASQQGIAASDRGNIYSVSGNFNSPASNELQVHSEPNSSNAPFSSFLTGNAQASRMFSRNLFTSNVQESMSLFGPSAQQPNPKQSTSRGRKGKNQVRIN